MVYDLLLRSVHKMISMDILFPYVITSLLVVSTTNCIASADLGDHLAPTDDVLDPFSSDAICQHYEGEYGKEYELSLVCCANSTLRLPSELLSNNFSKKSYQECSKEFKNDLKSDLPTGMWKAFLCELKKFAAFKSNKITFEEFMNALTKLYPEKIKNDVNAKSSLCKAIDSEKIEDDFKIQKMMECYNEAEFKVCHKPYGNAEDAEDYAKTMKQPGCPIIYGHILPFEYCCKGRSTPYPISEYPAEDRPKSEFDAVENCKDSFGKREEELMPDTFKVVTPETDDEEDHHIHTSWDVLCTEACDMEQKNYTQAMLKLDFEGVAEFYTKGFPSKVKSDISKIIAARKGKKIFLAMDEDSENSKPMTYQELAEKFKTADEKNKIQYYCKFVETVEFEGRRALHEYCFDEKNGNEWGDEHHPSFVGS